jgi:hypothetical protein
MMDEKTITHFITDTFAGVHAVDAWGDTFFFYNPDRQQPDEIYFATLKTKDDAYDRVSNVDRPAVYRLNIGISKDTYRSLFGAPPARASGNGDTDTGYDYTAPDQILPHPVYGRQYWVCVLNPSESTFQTVVQPLLVEAYDLAVSKYEKRLARG